MGKDAPALLLVVFVETIGGFISNRFIGLFLGAILLMTWLGLSVKKTLLHDLKIEFVDYK